MPNAKPRDVQEPINMTDQYMYAIVVRLDALCNMVSSLIEHIAEKEKIAVEHNTVKKVKSKKE